METVPRPGRQGHLTNTAATELSPQSPKRGVGRHRRDGSTPAAIQCLRATAPQGRVSPACGAVAVVAVLAVGAGQARPISHSFGSMWPRFSTTLNVPPSERAMYMFIRTWC